LPDPQAHGESGEGASSVLPDVFSLALPNPAMDTTKGALVGFDDSDL